MAEGHPLVGRTLEGRFRLTGFIGEGAMASVLRGVDLANGSVEVAVKVMHPHLAEDRTFAGRFKREAKAAAMLKHPNSVTILHFGEDDRMHFIAMELVRGKDLREVLKAEKRVSELRACRIVASICEALAAAHALGIIHRDLKPENVMVLKDPQVHDRDQVKVLDFGIAKLVDSSASKPRATDSNPDSEPPPALTQVGVVVGTPAYMSPEQCRGQPLDGRSDLYTCGILLFQLVTGRVPFESESPFETAGKQAFEPPPRPSQFLPSIDPVLEGLILRTLSKAPEERPQSATALRDELVDIARSLQSRLGKTMPMMASKPIIAAAEARAAQLAQEAAAAAGGVGAQAANPFAPGQQGSYAGPFPQAPQGPQQGVPMAPPAGATGPRGTIMQHDPSAPPLLNQQQQYPPHQQDHQQLHQQQQQYPPHQQDHQQLHQQQQQQQQQQGYGAQMDAQGGYPKPPETQNAGQRDEREGGGVGAGLTVLFILLSMFVGVGIGFALFRFLGTHG